MHGLHYYDFTNPEVSFLQTVKENEEGHSQRQLEQARLAKDLLYTFFPISTHKDYIVKATCRGGPTIYQGGSSFATRFQGHGGRRDDHELPGHSR
jgi:hypothetical protein